MQRERHRSRSGRLASAALVGAAALLAVSASGLGALGGFIVHCHGDEPAHFHGLPRADVDAHAGAGAGEHEHHFHPEGDDHGGWAIGLTREAPVADCCKLVVWLPPDLRSSWMSRAAEGYPGAERPTAESLFCTVDADVGRRGSLPVRLDYPPRRSCARIASLLMTSHALLL